MLKFVILLSAIACVWGAAVPEGMLPQLDGRIVGGSVASISDFAWQVSIQRSGSHFCGGTLYKNNIIISAAHCMQSGSASLYTVRAGSSYCNTGGVLVKVANFKNHEGYNPRTMVNDIAVIRLSSPLTISSTIKSIGLASTDPPNGADAMVSGWGAMYYGGKVSDELRSADVKIVDRLRCSSSSSGYGSAIQPSMICAQENGKDSCQGDSGGPLVSGNVLVGVVSWGSGCAHPNYPGVYADVADLRSWIVAAADSV